MRKILFWGDEGSGKSMLAALLARYAVAGGCSVLVVDAGGESAMPGLLGLPRPHMTLVDEMGGPSYVRRIYPSAHDICPVPDLPVDNLPSSCLSRRDNLALLSLDVGELDRVGARSLGWLFQDFMGRLDDTGWWVFIDGGRWFDETEDGFFEVFDGVLEVHTPDERGGVTVVDAETQSFFARRKIPLFSVVNRVLSQETMPSGEAGPDPLAFFPSLETAPSAPASGRGLPFPRDFLIPLRGLWEAMMSRFGSSHTSRAGFGGGSALRS